jgi:ATP-dependent RNA/DNA helicase IGHMBP2
MSSRKRRSLTSINCETHFVQMAEWLALESRAEVARMEERRRNQNQSDAERSGETLLDLVVADEVPGLGGQQLVTFRKRTIGQPLPWHRLKVGSPVVVSDPNATGRESFTGVVSCRTRDSIQIALSKWPDGKVFRIDLTADEVTRQRQLSAITTAMGSRGRLGHMRAVLMGEREAAFRKPETDVNFHSNLNPSQKNAVRLGLAAEDLALIHGPPGTGKTTTVVELIVQAIKRGDKVLACAPSNTAVDNLLERLIAKRQRVVRIGHPARVAQQLRDHSLDGLVEQHENMPVVRDMLREAEQIFRKSDKWTRAPRPRGERQAMRREAKSLIADARRLEKMAVQSILDRATVVCATMTFNEELLGDRWFDLAVVDEACQTTEPGCWVPLLRSDKIVLAGDPQQLPPTVLSQQAAREGFARSMMERQMEIQPDDISQLLDTQYRMHQHIMGFSSSQFYANALMADESVVTHKLVDLPGITGNAFVDEIVTFIDTAGAGWEEETEVEGRSRFNTREARLVLAKVDLLIESGLDSRDIAVIAPYAAQVRLLRERANHEGLEIDTVDGFQGREKEVVLITLVRSNTKNEIGFLADRRRMNVAMTRARRKLVVIGDSATLGGDDFYRDFLEYVDSVKGYHTVWEEDV